VLPVLASWHADQPFHGADDAVIDLAGRRWQFTETPRDVESEERGGVTVR
jgi:hypothetical protein